MEPPCMSCEEQEPEPQKGGGETKQVDDEDAELILVGVEPVNEDDDVIFVGRTKQVDDEDAELILVGVEHVNEDDDVIFVGMTSNSKPVVSNILH